MPDQGSAEEQGASESLWRAYSRFWENDVSIPNVFSFLREHQDASLVEQLEVLKVDQERRARIGVPLPVEEYLARFPHIAADRELKLDLVCSEFRVRERAGDRPDLEAFVTRFPDFRETLLDRFKAGPPAPPHEPAPPTPGFSPGIDSTTWFLSSGVGDAILRGDANGHPDRIGRYRVEGLLGEGGFGRVFLANDDQLERLVAIKLPHPDLFSEPEEMEFGMQEARILARLEHPAIVPVYDSGQTDDGAFYLVQKYIRGSNLATLLDRQRFSHSESVELVATVAEALHFVHTHHLVHRDVKPGNILVDGTGKAYLTDFGLALREEDFGKRERLGGTVGYMSPEQARLEGHLVDGRSDIFSLGAVFYEMLTGDVAFPGNSGREILDRIKTMEVRPPRQSDDSIPRELERICLKALSKRPPERYSTALDMAEDLKHFLKFEAPKAAGNGHSRVEEGAATAEIMPKGLRAFDAGDAGFFLKLLPGPRDRDGLPAIIRFWKSSIEEMDPDRTFRIGLLYGPSGCGKSSLVKAGVLPRLEERVATVYVEATPDHTESRLLAGLRKRCMLLGAELGLSEALTAVRLGGAGLPGSKLLIVVDQLEQWLHGRSDFQTTELVRSLRQCDGRRLQCLAIVRDDFWMAVAQFMQDLEAPLEESRNSAAVDLFDQRHARKVLTMFGRAFEALPKAPAKLTKTQESFVESAVKSLASHGRVIPVRLALFAEMFKSKTWSPEVLKHVGGTEGVGVEFLEENFGAPGCPPLHRLHEWGVRQVLKALLPEPGTNIRGHQCSHRELLAAAGPRYARGAKSFEELLRILDGDLRLLTPVDPEPGEEGDPRQPSAEKFYQLTHDDLVPPVREWLSRKEKGTRRGRARLRLAERAALWRSRGERKQLPSLPEFVGFLLLTRRKERTEAERKVLLAALGHHSIWSGVLLAVCLVLTLSAFEVERRLHARALYNSLLISEFPKLPEFIHNEVRPNQRWLRDLLREGLDKEKDNPATRLRLSLALLPEDLKQIGYLRERLLAAGPEELVVIRQALEPFSGEVMEGLWKELENGTIDARRFRAGCALAAYVPRSERLKQNALYLVEQLVLQAPQEIDQWTHLLSPAGEMLVPHLKRFPVAKGVMGRNVVAVLTVFLGSDKPELIGLLRQSDAAQFGIITKALRDEESLSLLKHEIAARLEPGENDAAAGVQVNIILAILMASPESDEVWEHFRATPNQRLRTFLIHSVRPFGVEAGVLVQRLLHERDDSIRQSLMLALGEYEPEMVPAADWEELIEVLVRWFKEDPDPGIHSAAEWLLRKWDFEPRIYAAVEELKGPPSAGRRWYITGEGHTMSLLPAAEHFQPDPEGFGNFLKLRGNRAKSHQPCTDTPHRFAVSTKEITVRQFVCYLYATGAPDKRLEEIESLPKGLLKPPRLNLDGQDGDRPVQGVQYAEAVEYCIWLSREEGLEPCYKRLSENSYAFYPERSGYRLPTYAEWEFACRGGTGEVQSRTHFGTPAFAESYAWFARNGEEQSHQVGRLKPNDFGLFDVHGNVEELCRCCYHEACDGVAVRGGKYLHQFFYIQWNAPLLSGFPDKEVGFRIVRTMK